MIQTIINAQTGEITEADIDITFPDIDLVDL